MFGLVYKLVRYAARRPIASLLPPLLTADQPLLKDTMHLQYAARVASVGRKYLGILQADSETLRGRANRVRSLILYMWYSFDSHLLVLS